MIGVAYRLRDGPRRGRSRRRGAALVYSMTVMVAMLAVGSLAVDLGHVHVVKTELQACADATARGYMQYYQANGKTYADAVGPQLYSASNNPVDGASGVAPTVAVQWGSWDAAAGTFTAGGGTPVAVKVVASRTAANGKPVRLFWAAVLGRSACDVKTSAVATLSGGQSTTVTVSATANPYLAGLPTGATAMYGDNNTNAAPFQVTAVPVVPGTWITLTNVAGQTNVLPGYVADSGAGGLTSIPVHHGQNYNYTISAPGPENGIADAVMPESAFMGLFLNDSPPDATAPPSTVDWTKASVQDQTSFPDIQLKQPFMIGTGSTSGGTVQRFLVPQGATRLFLGIWDGVAYYNNAGSLTATLAVQPTVTLVQ